MMASSCGQCLAIDSKFKCGYCQKNYTCILPSLCSEAPLRGLSAVEQCEVLIPEITMINPLSGPPEGITTITIDGVNLGRVLTDIVLITVGNRTCDIQEDQYIPGSRVICTTRAGTTNPVGTVFVTVLFGASYEGRNATSPTPFMVMKPHIDSVTPGFGPVSGGTQIIIRGSNLDIGNKENTELILREASGSIRRRKKSCPQANCNMK